MSTVYCSGNHSPEQLMKWLNETHDVSFKSFTMVPFGAKLNPDKKYKSNILIVSYRDYLRNASVLNHSRFKNKNFFVFAPPFRCAEIGNSHWLDFENDPELPGISYRLGDWNSSAFTIKPKNGEPVYRVDEDYKTKVIDHIKETGSILTPFMTLIYSLPTRSSQKPVSYALACWMYKGQSLKRLEAIFKALKADVPITKAKQEKFYDLLSGDLGKKAQDAFKLIRESKSAGKSLSYDAVAKNIGIQAYDLRYISKVVQSGDTYADQEGISIRDFQKQQDARRIKEKEDKAKAVQKVERKQKAKPIANKKVRKKKSAK